MQAAASSTSIAMDTLIYPRQGAARLEEVHCTWTHPSPYLQTVVLLRVVGCWRSTFFFE